MSAMNRLPLQALYYFYQAAELGSFKAAAQALFVTPGAMSQQIRQLEQQLDVALFERQHRRVQLTDCGEQLLPYARQAFLALQEGVRSVGQDPEPNILTVSTINSFAQQWLLPRMGALKQAYPELTIKLMPSNRRVDFNQDPVDLCIRFGHHQHGNLIYEDLMTDVLYPVCHRLYKKQHNIERLEDLAGCMLLEDNYPDMSWQSWLEAMQASFALPDSALVYDGSHMVVEGALALQGVALVRHSVAWRYIKQGLLVRLFDAAVSSKFRYMLCAPKSHFARTKVVNFTKWIKAEVADFLVESALPGVKIIR